jgi:N-acetylmuramic acid 6-phosphate etherase
LSIRELLEGINKEDTSVAHAVSKALPEVQAPAQHTLELLKKGGRLYYIGSGTSGRLGIVDASECPPAYGVPADLVVGIIAGGDSAIRTAVEGAEDDTQQGIIDLQLKGCKPGDMVVGISASGKTPYVVGALRNCSELGIATGSISCNPSSQVSAIADFPVEVVTGPEFVTGSTRMKAGTAQKLVLNMLTTSVMIGLGRVKGNKMVDMQLSNQKLVDRGTRMIMEEIHCSYEEARNLLLKNGSVRKAIDSYGNR